MPPWNHQLLDRLRLKWLLQAGQATPTRGGWSPVLFAGPVRKETIKGTSKHSCINEADKGLQWYSCTISCFLSGVNFDKVKGYLEFIEGCKWNGVLPCNFWNNSFYTALNVSLTPHCMVFSVLPSACNWITLSMRIQKLVGVVKKNSGK